MTTDITCIVATYGDTKWERLARRRALLSVVGQEFTEVLVAHDPAGGVTQPRNRLAAQAKGRWLLFLDADDELARGFGQAMHRASADADHLQVFTPAVSRVFRGRGRKAELYAPVDLVNGNYIVITSLISRRLFLELGGFRDWPQGLFDWDMWIRAHKAGATVHPVPDAVLRYHHNPHSEHNLAMRNRNAYLDDYHRVRRDNYPELYVP